MSEDKDSENNQRMLSELLGSLKDFQMTPSHKVTLGGEFKSYPKCPNCQVLIELEFRMCPECGYDLEQQPAEVPKGPVEKELSERQDQDANHDRKLQTVKKKLIEMLNGTNGSNDQEYEKEKLPTRSYCY